MSQLRAEAFYVYPIKSCAGSRVESPGVTQYGLKTDRFFMVVDQDGNFVSQRTKPKLALVRPEINYSDPDFIEMDVTAPGMENLVIGHEISVRRPVDFIETYVHGKPAGALRTTDEADEWFTDYLGAPVYLVANDPQSHRLIKDRYWHEYSANQVAFADAFPMLLASQASLDDFNSRMAEETGADPVPMDRFRPNIVVSGEDLEPYEEDYWRRIQIGRMMAYVVKPCDRCAIPYVDQQTGVSTGNKTVGKTLAATRRGRDTTTPDDDGRSVYFAQNLAHIYEDGLWITEGQEVVVWDRADESNVRLR